MGCIGRRRWISNQVRLCMEYDWLAKFVLCVMAHNHTITYISLHDISDPTWINETRNTINFSGTAKGFPVPDAQLVRFQEIINVLDTYYIPSLVVFGILGNTFCCTMILNSKLSKLSYAHYIASIMVADSLFLVNLFLLWLLYMGLNLYRIGALCHFTTFLSHSSSFLSLWYTVCLGLDRLLFLHYGNLQRHLLSALKAKVVTAILATIAIAVFLNICLTFGVISLYKTTLSCVPLSRFANVLHTMQQIDVFLNCLIPYLILTSVVFVGVIKLYCKRRKHRQTPMHRISRRLRHIYYGGAFERGQIIGPITFIGYYITFTLPSQSFRLYVTFTEMSGKLNTMDTNLMMIQRSLQYFHYSRFALNVIVLLLSYKGLRASTTACLHSTGRVISQLFKQPRNIYQDCDIEVTSEL